VSETLRQTEIVPASGAADMALVREYFLEYQTWLGVDLCFQGFEEELAKLPGAYAPPQGGLWFALVEGAKAGVVGLMPMAETGFCEMKRLWIQSPYRGLGLGRKLAETTITAARDAGHGFMRLDTLPQLARARALYSDLGFRQINAYYNNPLEGVIYLELDLAKNAADPKPSGEEGLASA